jgi:hypothetical protein
MATDSAGARPRIRVRLEDPSGAAPPREQVFGAAFRIGRVPSCAVRIDSPLVSREHVEVVFRDGRWRARDLGSRNGIWLDGARVEEAVVDGEIALRLGEDGPLVRLRAAGAPAPARDDEHYIGHYFHGDADGEAGEHTLQIRRAFQTVQQRQRRRFGAVLAALFAAAAALGGFALVQSRRHAAEEARLAQEMEAQRAELERARAQATGLFDDVRSIQAQIATLRMLMEERGRAGLDAQLAKLEDSRRRLERRYDGYVEELGLRRRLTPEERLIYRVARVFNESEFGMPAGFVERVRETIETQWLTPEGRGRFERAVRRAQDQRYTETIVRTLMAHGLAPHFFYLALQESDFDVRAVGPLTRWGRAKGMWQFIPRTALLYGLDPGPLADQDMVDPQDERHDFEKSTRAAAGYLRTIYATLAQASGLLVVASYNWGEHRVTAKLDERAGPQSIPVSALEGVPDTPAARSYWRFLGEFSERMPEETKDYVLRIFAAAVIGEDPRRYGFAFDAPLAPYLDRVE